jgi:hypothetical protein
MALREKRIEDSANNGQFNDLPRSADVNAACLAGHYLKGMGPSLSV